MWRNALISILLVSVAGCSIGPTEPEARTYYESLDLSSPEATIETFTSAFASDDFMTVWLTFDWQAQREVTAAFNLLEYGRLVDTSRIPDAGVTLTDPISDLIGRGNIDQWRVFDVLMLVADEHDAFLIEITELESMEQRAATAEGTASFAVEMTGADDGVTINLTQGEADRWFVHQVIVPGGDEDAIPWAVPGQ